MKKLVSSLMIGLIATTATMSVMAAPGPDHRHPTPAAHHFDKKPMPHKGVSIKHLLKRILTSMIVMISLARKTIRASSTKTITMARITSYRLSIVNPNGLNA
ncbi:hypothetical protein MOV98_03140 [Acinetobacter variabilis]|nr:hypothetical protein MOV98_03140 [Acinetobacter variabilis]